MRVASGTGRALSLVAVLLWVGHGIAPDRAGSSGRAQATTVRRAMVHDLSAPLRSVKTVRNLLPPLPTSEGDDAEGRPPVPGSASRPVVDAAVQTSAGGEAPAGGVSFDGVGSEDGFMPPDPNGAVGPNDYVQAVNASFAVFDKQGHRLLAPTRISSLWSGFGGPCAGPDRGDAVVLYDPLADRFLVSEFAFTWTADGPVGPFYECIAVTRTGDPTGAWYRYAFLISQTKMDDYPKLGVWPDAYYLTDNQFTTSGAWQGVGVVAFDRAAMLEGRDASMIYLDNPAPGSSGLLPADLTGTTPPPAGSPEYLVGFDPAVWGHGVQLWRFHVDWAVPASSTFTGPVAIPTDAFDTNMCGYDRDCIPQPGTADGLDANAFRLMYRLAYRNLGDHESLVVNHTVDVDGTDHAGIRWYEIQDPGGAPRVTDQGTFAPDGDHRFNGSVSVDQSGDVGVGYSVSGPDTYPSIRYTGRTPADPPGSLSSDEGSIVAGTGSQTSLYHRWGDYSSMTVDPQDGCTFWYTNEYYKDSNPWLWSTRIGSFRFPSCGAGPSLSIDDVAAHDGAATFTVTLSPAADHEVSVDYTTIRESANTADYTPASGTLTFQPGQSTASIAVPVASDATRSGTFAVVLSGAGGAAIGRSLGTATIGAAPGTGAASRPDVEFAGSRAHVAARSSRVTGGPRTHRAFVRPGHAGRFSIVIRNHGQAPMRVRVRGRGDTGWLRVRYLAQGRRVTRPVTHGRYSVLVPAHGARFLRLVVVARYGAPRGLFRGFRVGATSGGGRRSRDAVRAWVRVIR